MARNTGTAVGYTPSHLLATGIHTLREGSGILHTITLNTPVEGGIILIYDGVDVTGTAMGVIIVPEIPMPVTLTYDAEFKVGLTVQITSSNQDLTVTYI